MISQNSEKLKAFLSRLGFNPQKDFIDSPYLSKIGVDVAYESKIGAAAIYFKYLSESALNKEIANLHKNIWNENRTEVFVVVSDNQTLLCASKYKPLPDNHFACKLADFSYGVNTPGFEPEKLKPLLKENIDFGFFWDFIRETIKERKKRSVDDDLLLNLTKLKEDLSSTLSPEKKYILIERCLFLKFLEDRGFLVPHALIKILKSQDSQKLINKFGEVNKSLNGDIFDDKTVFTQQELSKDTLGKLSTFFTTDYRNRQATFFPYKFDIIPVELLSNIYEAFLKTTDQKKNGIYYTPSNLVDLVLSETLAPVLRKHPKPTCLDFACGSGIFLVKAFQKLIHKNTCREDFEEKKKLLKDCIFGVDKDPVATRISIFSLYLTLLEGEEPNKVRQSIKNDKIKFPKLFGKNILCNDTLFDELNFVNEDGKRFQVFDVVVGNPPWSVNPFNGVQSGEEMKLSNEKQSAVNDYQSSQYFTLKAEDLMSNHAVAGIVFNNSNLLMGQAKPFRQQMLNDYTIKTVYELTQCNSILFKKRKIEDLEIGAGEPAVAVIFKKKVKESDSLIEYITPSLDTLSKFLKIITIKSSEIKEVSQYVFFDDDRLWRILAIGDMEDYRLIKKLEAQKESRITGLIGFQPTDSNKYKFILKNADYADIDCVSDFVLKKEQIKKTPPEGIKIRRSCSGCNVDTGEFLNQKLLIKRYIEKDMKLKAAFDDTGCRFKDNLLGLLFDYDYRLMLSFYNSYLISYFLHLNSAQIGKGTWNMLHKHEIEDIPIPLENDIPLAYKNKLKKLTESVLEAGHADPKIIEEIDEIIFNIYHLKEFEKQRVRDFFALRYRIGRNAFVKLEDLQKYANRFRNVFSFILKKDRYLNAKVYISNSVGVGILFVLADIKDRKEEVELLSSPSDIKEFIAVTKMRLDNSQKANILRQDKVKLYNQDSFVIIKSNQFKDWTETEAIKDANEEIGEWLKQLPRE
ncbi:MAG: N-6 DNA methylase [Nitrospinae bacterium]|nr:N-6 DNA methylase [Nitrospinota bacterium]